ncbi:MAG TPA: HNH endonuclease signature motif containing protein [Mycobacterium sp.]|nr:HNH endonuclease signature motif containing protein [Mycobacterium sp.]
MFDTTQPGPLAPGAAVIEELLERRCPTETPESAAMIERIAASARQENRAAASRLVAIGDLFAYRLSRCTESEDWAVDTTEAVAAEVAAALRISQGLAVNTLGYARALRERLPRVGAAFIAGDIDFATFRMLVYRTDLLTDPDVVATVDAELAVKVPRWSSMSRGRQTAAVDRIVSRRDPDAVRRRNNTAAEQEVWVSQRLDGLADVGGTVRSVDGIALDARLSALAATVCDHDPRSQQTRRSDAIGALVAGADRLACLCGRADCPAADAPTASPVMIHVVAEQATIEGRSDTPAAVIGSDAVIAPEVLAELVGVARRRPLINPGDAPAESGYVPSRVLADFVRYRDMTCRFPGCDKPAFGCDMDHTIAHADGGPTQASNLKCLCRLHHLVKTFGSWRDQQLRDGTVIWTSPAGCTYVTHPGSALLFPSLCAPTAEAVAAGVPDDRRAARTAMMPRRTRTRAQNRAARIAAERRDNRRARQTSRRTNYDVYFGGSRPPPDDDDPPPF